MRSLAALAPSPPTSYHPKAIRLPARPSLPHRPPEREIRPFRGGPPQGTPPTLDATTGTSHAIASSATSPNDSVSLGSNIRSEIDRISPIPLLPEKKYLTTQSSCCAPTTRHLNVPSVAHHQQSGKGPSAGRDQKSQPRPSPVLQDGNWKHVPGGVLRGCIPAFQIAVFRAPKSVTVDEVGNHLDGT